MIDLEEIASSAIEEHIDREMQDNFLHILEGWIFEREGLDFEDMINQAITNKVARKFKSIDTFDKMLNQAIQQRLNTFFESEREEDNKVISLINEVIDNKICNQFGSMNLFKKVNKEVEDSISSYIEAYFKDWLDLEESVTTALFNKIDRSVDLKTVVNEKLNEKITSNKIDKLINDFITCEFGVMNIESKIKDSISVMTMIEMNKENISEIIGNVAFEVIKDRLKDGCTFNISSVRKEDSK